MFEAALDPARDGLATASALAEAISTNHDELLRAECRVLELAALWADAYGRDAQTEDWSPLVERATFFGGAGTPAVDEFCVDELAALTGTGHLSAQVLIADALDLRHRLPLLWRRLLAGEVRAWHARRVAEHTRRLTWDACRDLDRALSGQLGMTSWGRFARMLTAAILDADPDLAAERAAQAATQRDVWASQSEAGIKTIIARAAAGDAGWFMATINRLADILGAEGDPDPTPVLRSKAIGILAQPALALALLTAHRDDPANSADPAAPADPADPAKPADPDGPEDGPAAARPSTGSGPETEPGNQLAADRPSAGSGHEPVPNDPTVGTGGPDEAALGQGLVLRPPTAAELRAARPRVVLRIHLSDYALWAGHGVARPEHGDPTTLQQLHDWLADTGCALTVQPVLDPAATAPVDGYEIPARIRDALLTRNIADVFPFGSCTTATMDADHTIPYDPHGPPGQTGLHDLGPMTRHHHRVVTHGGWRKRQPDPGTYLFRSRLGYISLVTNRGTLPLSNTPFTDAVWHAAAPPDRAPG